MAVTFSEAIPVTRKQQGRMTQTRSGTIASGNKFLNSSFNVDYSTGKAKTINGVLPRMSNGEFSDIYSHIFRRNMRYGRPLEVVERLAQNGNRTKTYAFNGIRRLKVSHKAGKFAGVTLFNSKGTKLNVAVPKFLKALF